MVGFDSYNICVLTLHVTFPPNFLQIWYGYTEAFKTGILDEFVSKINLAPLILFLEEFPDKNLVFSFNKPKHS